MTKDRSDISEPTVGRSYWWEWLRSSWLAKSLWVGLGIVVTIGLIALIVTVLNRETRVTVTCEPIKGGVACDVEPSGSRVLDANVCWELHHVCENGTKSMAAKCIRTSLEPGQRVRTLIANAEFSNHDKCDKLSARQIESVSISPKRGRPSE